MLDWSCCRGRLSRDPRKPPYSTEYGCCRGRCVHVVSTGKWVDITAGLLVAAGSNGGGFFLPTWRETYGCLPDNLERRHICGPVRRLRRQLDGDACGDRAQGSGGRWLSNGGFVVVRLRAPTRVNTIYGRRRDAATRAHGGTLMTIELRDAPSPPEVPDRRYGEFTGPRNGD